MNSMLFQTCVRIAYPILIGLSIILLYRGHNLPGGGFIGGLVAATAYLLTGMACGTEAARKLLKVHPKSLIFLGLAVALLSGVPGMFGGAYMEALWLPTFELPLLGKVHLGTPLVFDVGVYGVVIGFVLLVGFELMESEQ